MCCQQIYQVKKYHMLKNFEWTKLVCMILMITHCLTDTLVELDRIRHRLIMRCLGLCAALPVDATMACRVLYCCVYHTAVNSALIGNVAPKVGHAVTITFNLSLHYILLISKTDQLGHQTGTKNNVKIDLSHFFHYIKDKLCVECVCFDEPYVKLGINY